MIEEHDIKTEDVESIECFGNEHKVRNLKHHNPQHGLEAKFSLEYWLANGPARERGRDRAIR